ncbi:hypothetical protein GCM10011583_26410 [Streptomyces camponoticapitis]|uniref:Uncharacterized protein n=1 Tax=Streptomyces camponoticapitis TaxID=1616125 RepID=A0ABQ2E462_9ACTN|nr:hypothetical protein [Streptomyces camponoticapitis]GGJ93637.1 hypothetical protein GCM10011583_26410 [Streptomyces camponoticapitis]
MTSGAPAATGGERDPLDFKAAVDARTAAVERLATAPYAPPWPDGVDPGRSGAGADFAIVALRVSPDFYEDEDGDLHAAVTDEYETELWGVVLALDTRWGTHLTVGLEEYGDRHLAGEPVPPFYAALFDLGYFGDLQTWRVGGRLVAVGVGQMDAEEPLVLFAAVSGAPGT